MDLTGLAALITSITGVFSLVLTAVILLRVNHNIKLSNSNFSAMQHSLDTAIERNTQREDAVQ